MAFFIITKTKKQSRVFLPVPSDFQYQNEKLVLQPTKATLSRNVQCKKVPWLSKLFHFDSSKHTLDVIFYVFRDPILHKQILLLILSKFPAL